MSSKQKTVIRLQGQGVLNDKNRSKAMQLASKFAGVNSVAITGDAKDRLEVIGESIDIPSLINRLRKKVCRADIVVVEEVKDNKKKEEKKEDEEEKKKKEEEAKKKKQGEEEKKKKEEEELKKSRAAAYPLYAGPPPPTFVYEERQPEGCHIS